MAAAKKQSGALTVPGVDEQRELELLRRENKRLAKDCEILRCAVAPIL
jgi:hypothetical protein